MGFEAWIKEELMDIRAFKSTIDGLNQLKMQRQKLCEKLNTANVSMDKLSQGKSAGIKTMFGKSKEKEKEDIANQLPIVQYIYIYISL